MKEFDTICAISTSLGVGGISIIRISGPKAVSIIKKIFKDKDGKVVNQFKSYSIKYGYIYKLNSDEVLDEVLVSFMKGPKSYTGEDVIEINTHGGAFITNRILEESVLAGARLAERGEFTKRAFLNGRIDLAQSEAVNDIINAETDSSAKAAIYQSKGIISNKIKSLREKILLLTANIEATVDYPEEDLEEVTAYDGIKKITELSLEINKLIESFKEGKIIRDGLDVVIIGKPNVGKSSLLNSLLQENRAIVTEIPGTTRDIIEEHINLDGILIKLTDTAGIRDTEDVIEKIGVERSKERIIEADLIILVFDRSSQLSKEDLEIIESVKDKNFVVLLNKSDLNEDKINIENIPELKDKKIINISAKFGEGIGTLKEEIKNMFFSNNLEVSAEGITNLRHIEALIRAEESLNAAVDTLKNVSAVDLASIDLKNAYISLGEITGESTSEDIINKIFENFCLGK
ncbi:MAG: tRNA uridine-5-carboxymethylaminomethyl(34) synthesis GTPase MnmE [Clostridiaceae bacterium]